MKNILILITLLSSQIVFAQNSVLDNQIYLRGGVSVPLAGFGTVDQINGTDISGLDAPAFSNGFYSDIGGYFYIDSLVAHKKMKLGVDFTFLSFQYNKYVQTFPTEDVLIAKEECERYREDHFYAINPAVKIGALFSYSPYRNLAIDAFVKANLYYSVWYVEHDYVYNIPGVVHNYNQTKGGSDDSYSGFNVKGSFGLNLRYKVFLLGLEYCPGSMKYYDMDQYSGNQVENFRISADSFICQFGLSL